MDIFIPYTNNIIHEMQPAEISSEDGKEFLEALTSTGQP